MKYTAVSTSEWAYPDIKEYSTAAKSINCHAARGGRLSSQVLLCAEDGESGISYDKMGEITEFDIEFFEMVPVFVGETINEPSNPKPFYPNRRGPFYIYDCLKPLGESITAKSGVIGLYISAKVPHDRSPGVYKGGLLIKYGKNSAEIPVEFTVYPAVLPKETLKFTTWYSYAATAQYHKTEMGSNEFKRIDLLYHKMLRHMHMNMYWLNMGACVKIKTVGENKYEFDFSVFEEYVKMAVSLGFKYFQTSSLASRKSWSESAINVKNGELSCLSYEGYLYLSQYLEKLGAILKNNGWTDMFYIGVSDEPNEANAVEYRALCGIIRHLLPKAKLYDAMSHGPFYGSLDVYVPLNSEYENHRDVFERFRGGGDELWHYVCCGPRGDGYINRFMDYPLLATRYLFWGNYKYDLTGYLHWSVNHYQKNQNPFTDNWPEHWNAGNSCILPPGDAHIIYPGEGEPWMSMRLEAHRESAEDYEMLKAIAQKDKAAADRLCEKCFRKFNDVENDASAFEKTKIEILEALGKLQGN
jgi:hypothetical protein